MRNLNKRGDATMMWMIIFIVLALVTLGLLMYYGYTTLKKSSDTTTAVSQCDARGDGGCFAESAVEQKRSEGYMCTKGILGCDSSGTTPYCCQRIFA